MDISVGESIVNTERWHTMKKRVVGLSRSDPWLYTHFLSTYSCRCRKGGVVEQPPLLKDSYINFKVPFLMIIKVLLLFMILYVSSSLFWKVTSPSFLVSTLLSLIRSTTFYSSQVVSDRPLRRVLVSIVSISRNGQIRTIRDTTVNSIDP